MIKDAPRRGPNAPAYYIGRPAAYWLRVMQRPRRSPLPPACPISDPKSGMRREHETGTD